MAALHTQRLIWWIKYIDLIDLLIRRLCIVLEQAAVMLPFNTFSMSKTMDEFLFYGDPKWTNIRHKVAIPYEIPSKPSR